LLQLILNSNPGKGSDDKNGYERWRQNQIWISRHDHLRILRRLNFRSVRKVKNFTSFFVTHGGADKLKRLRLSYIQASLIFARLVIVCQRVITSYKLHTNFLKSSFKPLSSFLWASCKLFKNSHELLIKFLQTSYKTLTNVL
jgi:hypothetical protein